MPSSSENNKAIARNTLFLYLRMLFTLFIGLYVSRVVLEILGVVDFGVYNVVGGVVSLFTFVSAPMIATTQRYLTFELGKGETNRLQLLFSTSLKVHILLALIIILLAESVGLWFLYNKLVIPDDRFDVAKIVYQLSVLSCVVSLVIQPYYSLIIAHERMSVYSGISIVEAISKLLIVFSLKWILADKLMLYALFCFSLTIFTNFCYVYYCQVHFRESRICKEFDRPLFKEMAMFAGWNFFGGIAFLASTQGVNILLNLFFGPVVNAARAIAIQVQSATRGFVDNFQMAVNPQITKSYSINDKPRLYNLIFYSSKYSFFLILIITMPIILEADVILNIWLVEVPEHSANFVRLTLIGIWINALFTPLTISLLATGKIRLFQVVDGLISVSIIPISYVFLNLGYEPEIVFVNSILIGILGLLARIILSRKRMGLPLHDYYSKVVVKICLVTFISFSILLSICPIFDRSLFSSVVIVLLSIMVTSIVIYYVGIGSNERALLIEKIRKVKNKVISFV